MKSSSALFVSLALVIASAPAAQGQTPGAATPAAAASPAVQPSQTPNDLYRVAQQLIRDRKFAEAVAQSREAAGRQGLSAIDRNRFLRLIVNANFAMRTPAGNAAGLAELEAIIADKALTNTMRIDAIKAVAQFQIAQLAGLDLYQMDLGPANATLERALKLENLKADEQIIALMNIADLYRRQDRHADGRAALENALNLAANDKAKEPILKAIAETLMRDAKPEAAFAIYAENKFDTLPLFAMGPWEKLKAECMRILADSSLPDAQRWNAFRALPMWNWMNVEYKEIHRVGQMYMAGFLEAVPARASTFLPMVKRVTVDDQPEFYLWAARIVLEIKSLSAADYTLVQTGLVNVLALTGKFDEARALAAELVKSEKLTPQARAWADLVASVNVNADMKADQKSIADVLARHKDLSSKEKADALLAAGQTFLRGKFETAAKATHAAYTGLIDQLPAAQVLCVFDSDSPTDVGSWLASGKYQNAKDKASLDRPYGDNIRFLVETDSATTGREAAAQSTQMTADDKTDLQVIANHEGLHIFLKAHDTKAREIIAGTMRGGGFEMYLAPGEQQAYYTFLSSFPRGDFKPEMFLTSYPNSQFRILSEESGTFRGQTRPLPEGFATHLFLSWEVFYDKLPENGTRWQFDSIRWTRSGGFSFGGSKSVHNRSSWGDIVFDGMTPENLRAIKRAIIPKAITKYRKTKDHSGPVGHWMDPELGDPAFYNEHVAPLISKLDAYIIRGNKGLSDEDVEEYFKDAVPGWMELEFQVAELRRKYLEAQLLNPR